MKESYKDYYDSYSAFSTKLRTWLGGFGVGAIALLASQEHLLETATRSEKIWIVSLLLYGSGIQAIYIAAQKFTQWAIAIRDPDTSFNGYGIAGKSKSDCWYKISKWCSDGYLFDFFADFVAITAYVVATFLLLVLVAAS